MKPRYCLPPVLLTAPAHALMARVCPLDVVIELPANDNSHLRPVA